MPDATTPLDLDAIRVRADARRDYADERPESLHVPEDYAAVADESAADVPALVEEVKRLRSESQRFYENRNLWQKRAEKAEAERDVARADVALLRPALAQLEEAFEEESDAHDALKAEVARLTARPAPAWDEEAAALAVFERSHEPPFEDSEEGMREAKRFVRSLAVVREHLQ